LRVKNVTACAIVTAVRQLSNGFKGRIVTPPIC
jgi:hypothetical protein